MSSNKEEKSQDAADRIKAAALTAAKGLSRAQAERAATAAARNVNAYGQKEEGPSRWQEKREAKRQMYLMSTEKAVRLGERKDLKVVSMPSAGGSAAQCQKCYQLGHWTYECKNERVYISRPSRTQQLKNPKLRMKMAASYELDNPDPVKEKKTEKHSKKKSKRKHAKSGSGSKASVSETDSGSSSDTGSDDSSEESSSDISSSSESESERSRRRRKKQKRGSRKKRYSSSSESSDSDSDSGSESESDSGDERSRRKSRRHSRRR